MNFRGQVRSGQGRGASFTRLPWARQQFLTGLGIDPFPGTLNLEVPDTDAAALRAAIAASPALDIRPGDGRGCAARCVPVLVSVPGREPVTGAIVWPQVSGYAAGQAELIAAVCLRETLGLQDNDPVTISWIPTGPWRGVIFDVDGTLVDSLPGYRRAAERVAAPYGWEITDEAVHRALNFGESFWSLVVPADSRDDQALLDRLGQETLAHWPAVLEECVALLPGIEAALGALRGQGLRLGIWTASRGESFLPLERAGLLGLFDAVITGGDVNRRKPDPEGLLLCLDRLGLAAADSVYVGDTIGDMQASRAAGLHAIGVLTGAADSALLSRAGAHRIVADFHQLPRILLRE